MKCVVRIGSPDSWSSGIASVSPKGDACFADCEGKGESDGWVVMGSGCEVK